MRWGQHKKCLDWMGYSIQHMRRMVTNSIKWADARGLNYIFFSESNKQGQNTHSCTNTHVTDSTARGYKHAIGVYAAYTQLSTNYRFKREGYSHFRPHVKPQNYRMSTDERDVMPVGWGYPTVEDNIGQDLLGKYQKTSQYGPNQRKFPYIYDRLTHDKSKDLKKKPKCEKSPRYVIASMTPVHTNEYVPVSISLTQTMRDDDGCPKKQKGGSTNSKGACI